MDETTCDSEPAIDSEYELIMGAVMCVRSRITFRLNSGNSCEGSTRLAKES